MIGRSACKYAGHCWHEAGGVPYQRHAARPVEDVAVTCCFCGETRELPMHAKQKAGTPDPKALHGKFLEESEAPDA